MANLPASTTNLSSIDFLVDTTTGIGYISQRKAAELCGVKQPTFNSAIREGALQTVYHNLNSNKQLDEESLLKAVYHYAQKGSTAALSTMYKLTKAGIRAYIYTQAGYNPLAQPAAVDRLHEPSIQPIWIAEQTGRSIDSVRRTIKLTLRRLAGTRLASEVKYEGARMYISPAVALCSTFTGKDMQKMRVDT